MASKVVHEEANFKAILHEPNSRPIYVADIRAELRPEELHLIPDGAVGDKPSLMLVCSGFGGERFIVQISGAMLKRGLDAFQWEYFNGTN